MFIVPVIVGIAGFVDGLATGVWATRKWGSKSLVTQAETALVRATTIPAGGLTTIVEEVRDAVPALAEEAETLVNKVTAVGTEVNTAVQSVTDLHAKLDGLIKVAVAAK